jgi:hypothetical protein
MAPGAVTAVRPVGGQDPALAGNPWMPLIPIGLVSHHHTLLGSAH